jgi:hypothetical protein
MRLEEDVMTLKQRIGRLCIKLALTLLVSAGLMLLPDGSGGELLPYKNAVVSLLTVIVIGVTLYDTFFYNRGRW